MRSIRFIFCILLPVSLIGLSVRSYAHIDSVTIQWLSLRVDLESAFGRTRWSFACPPKAIPFAMRMAHDGVETIASWNEFDADRHFLDDELTHRGFLGFAYFCGLRSYIGSEEPTYDTPFVEVVVPLWAIVLLSGIPLVLPVVRAERSRCRIRRGMCVRCGYDLRAHKPGDKCPECGTPVGPVRPIQGVK